MQDTIEREFEALRDIKRRSSSQGGPGSLRLDPDLPPSPSSSAAPPLSPQAWAEDATAVSPTRRTKSLTSGATGTTGNAAAGAAPPANGDGGEDGGAGDQIQLYWVPAHLHPELAPTEFRAFLKEHAHGPPADEGGGSSAGEGTGTSTGEPSARMPGGTAMARSDSQLGRKRSMLSRQYKPRANDGVEEEHVVPSRRKSMFVHEGPQLTISDLQKLEELADEASRSDDPTKLRRMLRRSMSMNVAPSFLDQIDDVNEPQDEADAPIIIPPPNQILRRTARTKIRKPNLSGDGGGHRFPTTRRKPGSAARQNSVDTVVSPTDASSSGHSGEKEDVAPPLPALRRPPKVDAEGDGYDASRRLTYTEETSIFDAYADEPDEDKATPHAEPPPLPPMPRSVDLSMQTPPTTVITEPETEPPQPLAPSAAPNFVPILHQPQPQKRLSPQQQQVLEQERQPSRTPSPDSSTGAHEITRPESRSSVVSEAPSHISSTSTLVQDKRKEKDKKSLWRKVGGSGDKHSKKTSKEEKKDKEREREKEKEKEKESSGFFNSIFGGGKKKQEEAPVPSNLGGGAGPATAAAMLGASKSKQPYSPTLSPQLGNPYARYPIHVERAVYRLSHIKLANPRRPLYEQVLISNLMFWYLGVINKASQPQGQQPAGAQGPPGQQGMPQAGVQGQENAPAAGAGAAEREAMEREQAEREQRERAEREREERERAEKERAEAAGHKRDSGGKRGSLTKPAAGAGGRRAEVAVKGPQYHLQSQVIEQEYGAGAPVRVGSAPPPSMNGPQQGGYGAGQGAGYKRPGAGGQHGESQSNGNAAYYGRSNSLDMGSGGGSGSSLPPGAMAPLSSSDQLWLASQSAYGSPPQQYTSQTTEWNSLSQPAPQSQQPLRNANANAPPRGQGENADWRPERDHTSGAKTPMRSLSANAVSSTPQGNNNYAQYSQFGYQQPGAGGNDVYGGIEPQQHAVGAMKKKPGAPLDRKHRASEDEDVPLAVWHQHHHQHQQRRK